MEVMDGVFFGYIYLTPIITLFGSPSYYLKNISHVDVDKFIDTEDISEHQPYTQHEANEVYKKLDWYISSSYASFIKTFAVTLFFLPTMPYCIFYSIIALCIQYFAEKVKLVK